VAGIFCYQNTERNVHWRRKVEVHYTDKVSGEWTEFYTLLLPELQKGNQLGKLDHQLHLCWGIYSHVVVNGGQASSGSHDYQIPCTPLTQDGDDIITELTCKWHCSNLFFWKGKGQIPFCKGALTLQQEN